MRIGQKIKLLMADITTLKVDAIVNAANARLQHGGGVAAAISHRGGPIIQQESDEWCAGRAHPTTASRLTPAPATCPPPT